MAAKLHKYTGIVQIPGNFNNDRNRFTIMLSGYGVFCTSTIYVSLFCSLMLSTCTSTFLNPFYVPYNLGKADEEFELRNKLNEASGINVDSSGRAYLIDDEKGSVFYYDLIADSIVESIKFSRAADYEDLVKKGDTLYVLKSNGTITELILDSNRVIKAGVYRTPLKSFNNTEGLCYDSKHNRLLIACKGDPTFIKNDKRFRGKKAIYSFDLTTKKLNEKPVILIDVHKVESMVLGMQKNIIRRIMNLYSLSTKALFQPSGISINPLSGEIYVISSVGNIMVIMNEDGKILHTIKLSKSMFKQPEGIAFDNKGALYIANEGKSGKAMVLKFLYKDKG